MAWSWHRATRGKRTGQGHLVAAQAVDRQLRRRRPGRPGPHHQAQAEEDPVPAPPDRRLPGRRRPENRALVTLCTASSIWFKTRTRQITRHVVRCCTSLGEQVAMPRDELLDGLRGSAGDFLDAGGHAVIPILAMKPGHGGDLLIDVRTEPGV